MESKTRLIERSMDDCTHARVLEFLKAVGPHTRPLKTLKEHYDKWTNYQRVHLDQGTPSEDLALIRRGVLAVLREDGGYEWGFSEETLYVAVVNYGDEFHIFHGEHVEILMAALGSNHAMMRSLFEMRSHMSTIGDRRLMVAYVVAPWHADASQFACELRCTRVDGSSDSEAIALKDGRMVLNVPSTVTLDCETVNARLRSRVKYQFSSHHLAPCSTKGAGEIKSDVVPRVMYDKLAYTNKQLLEEVEEMRKQVDSATKQTMLVRETVPMKEILQSVELAKEMGRLEARLRTEHNEEIEALKRKHKAEVEEERRRAAEAAEGAIKLIKTETTSPKKDDTAPLRRQVSALTHEVEEVRARHKKTCLELEAMSTKHKQALREIDTLHDQIKSIRARHSDDLNQQTSSMLADFDGAFSDIKARFEGFLRNCVLERARRLRIRVALLTYLRRESVVRDDVTMKCGVIRTRVRREFEAQMCSQHECLEALERRHRLEVGRLLAENCTLKEMVSDCDIDIFTLGNKIKDIRRANIEYLRHVIMHKRQKNVRFKSVFDPTSRALIDRFKQTHEIGRAANPVGFFYPIRHPSGPPSSNSTTFQPQSPSDPVSVHYHHHHHIHMGTSIQS